MKRNKTYFKSTDYNESTGLIIKGSDKIKKNNFATVVTTDYSGQALIDIYSRIYGGAPTIEAGIFNLRQSRPENQGDKYVVKFPKLSIPDSVVQTSSPVYGQATYTATNSQTLEYVDIPLFEKHILDEVNFNEFVKDYQGKLMPQGDMNDEVPSNVNDALINLYIERAAATVEEDLWTLVGSAIDTEADASTAGCAFYDTATLADLEDATKVRKELSDIVTAFVKAKKKRIRRQDVAVFVPVGVYESFQFSMPVVAVDASGNVASSIANQIGVYGIYTSHAIPDNKIYLMTANAIGLVTDSVADWTDVSVLNLGDTDKKLKNKAQYAMFWRFGAEVIDLCVTGRVTLS